MILLTLSLLAAAAQAQPEPPAQPAAPVKPEKPKKICRQVEETGSRGMTRVCKTAEQWAEHDARDDSARAAGAMRR
jgi:hypothetical protein